MKMQSGNGLFAEKGLISKIFPVLSLLSELRLVLLLLHLLLLLLLLQVSCYFLIKTT